MNSLPRTLRTALPLILVIVSTASCGPSAKLDLATANAVSSLTGQLQTAISEYHEEIRVHDDVLESQVITAFVERVKRDHANEQAIDNHSAQFTAALEKIRLNREIETERQQVAEENAELLQDVANQLRELAIKDLALQEETQQMLLSLLQTTTTTTTTTKSSNTTTKSKQTKEDSNGR